MDKIKELAEQFNINSYKFQEFEQAVEKKWSHFDTEKLLGGFISLGNEYRVHEKDLVQVLIYLSNSEVSVAPNSAISMYTALFNKYVGLLVHPKLFTDCLVQFDLLLKNKEFLSKIKQEVGIEFPERAVYTGNLMDLLLTMSFTLNKEKGKEEKFLSILEEFDYHSFYGDLLVKILNELINQERLYYDIQALFLSNINTLD